MKAAVFMGPGKSLEVQEIDIPKLADDEILVKMKAATLNYRDLIMIDGGYGPIGGQPPFIPISDGAGIVKEVGKSIKNFKVSDVVIPPFFVTSSHTAFSNS